MTYARVQENTLGVPIGVKPSRLGIRARAPRGLPGRLQIPRSSLGTSYLAVGVSVVVAIRGLWGFIGFLMQLPAYPRPVLAVASWIVLVSVGFGAAIAVRLTGDRMENWKFAWFLFGLAGAVTLDLVSVWDLHDVGRYATASVTAGMVLLLVLTRRGPIEIVVSSLALGTVLAIAIAVETQPGPGSLARQLSAVAFAVLPGVVGVTVITNYRRMVQLELDRALVQSTLTAPRFAVGMHASKELARLDLNAETLLDSIANGETRLPLEPETASTAASLATELRLHLLEGRRETWLYHAITESEMLGKTVTLRDPNSLAGLLGPAQRDGLLSAVWMLVSDSPKPTPGRSIEIVLGPIDDEGSSPEQLCVPVALSSSGIPRSRVDREVWDALGKVGDYQDSMENSSLHVVIDGMVDRPRDVERSRS